jgi:hypothetical protein
MRVNQFEGITQSLLDMFSLDDLTWLESFKVMLQPQRPGTENSHSPGVENSYAAPPADLSGHGVNGVADSISRVIQ